VFSILKYKAEEAAWQGESDEVLHSAETQRRLQHGSYAELLRRKRHDESSDSDDERQVSSSTLVPRRARDFFGKKNWGKKNLFSTSPRTPTTSARFLVL
jgi:hypothetical protein